MLVSCPFPLVAVAVAAAASRPVSRVRVGSTAAAAPRSASGVRMASTGRALGATFELPAFLPDEASEVNEPAALRVLGKLQRVGVEVDTPELQAVVPTTFWRSEYASADAPALLFLHGADASVLEWRYVADQLGGASYSCTAVDWWTGGWTERAPITRRLRASDSAGPAPWTLVRQHLHAFWRQQLGAAPVVLVGASLGGAVALDFAAAHPEAVRALVLVDAGGQSYRAPPPIVVRALAPAVLAVKAAAAAVQRRLPAEGARLASLHRAEAGWADAYGAYLASGGYACRVGPRLIRTIAQPALVVWGADDRILPLEDAYAFARDLRGCVGVREVAAAGHTPHLDDPAAVVALLRAFVDGLED